MSLDEFKQLLKDEKIRCPKCKQPVKQFDKYIETIESIWDGAGDSNWETGAAKVTLICGNDGCAWKERTEYWDNYLETGC